MRASSSARRRGRTNPRGDPRVAAPVAPVTTTPAKGNGLSDHGVGSFARPGTSRGVHGGPSTVKAVWLPRCAADAASEVGR